MVLLSTFIHLALFGILSSAAPFFKSKKITYTPVYTVSLVSLPQIRKASKPVKKEPVIKPLTKSKPVELLSKKKKSIALAKLNSLEKDLEKIKPLEKKNDLFEEKDIPEMLAALNEINSNEIESGLLDDREETKNKIIEELNKLEKKWEEEKDKPSDIEKFEKSKSLEQLEKLEKKWEEETAQLQPYPETDKTGMYEALEKLIGKYTPVSSQNINVTPSYLSIYFAVIQSEVRAHWENPSGVEILSEEETNKKTVVSFNILRSGRLADYKIQNASGNRTLDNLAISAVKNADPLPPLPSDYPEDFLRVILDFNYSLK